MDCYSFREAVNHKPTLKAEQSPPSKVNIGEYVTLKLSAYDNDGNLQQIDVDWEGSGKYVDSKHVYIMRLLHFQEKFTKEGNLYNLLATGLWIVEFSKEGRL